MSAAADPATQPREETASASPLDAHASPVSDTKKHSGKATAALVLGILGTLVGFVIPAVGLVLGILGIVFGRQAVNDIVTNGAKSGRGVGQAGFVLGIVAVVVSIAIMIIRVVIITS
jgi:hypothetical protein